MRFFAVLALTAVASAASTSLIRRQQFPSCSNNCLATADFGSCDPLDDGCLCNSPSFVNSVTSCIEGACQGDDLKNAEGAAQALCAAVGVTLTSAPAATSTAPTSTSGSAPTSTSGSAPTSTGAPAGTDSTSAPASSQTAGGNNGAASHGASALVALAAVGAAALIL